ncbi:TRAP transporter substrate-binding protein [Marinomonas mediterranea]|jgi:TRAP-type mannitol/chloroaromatic compound transport system, periplasmic component|uniref:Extracellular solute-binding protein, family 7 n=1 Tax=Marinomonas mediterranea (strain ATCC 700492 / JCM 21426 / NBRC 103028 / MMB-1) TaxID=717774 RepID=F2K124_MARM1|nr:TRAP transporter substrate-binding protein DctP [Marinomonas mediterranea]ADZ93373.1 Extracellular solute-binding protein, family 7 [Marinomonas mediterranea MMB-1]WCN11261.1 ABC transporter substrate-binding protein [Marinomonas mediterranea]WCN15325.1 ABC transporter substrate-binding protein [Marinomonas mediterranea]WCN19369.1 ABC transporter substrate-binding protein [Marinomonas mediterranea MMB-1]
MKKVMQFGKLAAASLLAVVLTACGGASDKEATKESAKSAQVEKKPEVIKWKMVTTWPKNFPALGTGAEYLAKNINEMSGGRLQVKVYAAGELVPPLEVFDAVSRGTAEMGHAASYYWKGKVPASQFFASIPFGLTAQELNSWIYHGGGLELWEEIYQPFNVLPMAGGNTGVQMGGWFNKEINSVADLKGLKMRIPGLGGEVLKKAGGVPVNLPGGEIFTSLQTGAIDATEFVGPYNDLAFGLYKAAKYYYYPGWHEPGSAVEITVNKDAYNALPKDLQAIVRAAARQANADMLDEFTARNNEALQTLISEHGVELREFPADALAELRDASEEVIEELAANDPASRKVYDSLKAFKEKVSAWHTVSERAYINARDAE